MEEFYKGGVALDLQDIDDLSDDQKNALVSIRKWWNHRTTRYFAVGGVAGSGKTTLISRLAEELKLPESNVLYCAFTGKAALVMRRKGIEADTIHHGIYDAVKTIENGKISYEFVLRSLLSRSYRLIVIDESSMIGDKLWADILSFGIPVIIFGDHQQLPPVEGKLNLMENPDFKMEKVLRQLEDSPILRLASMAINGETIKFGEFGSGVIKKRAVDLVDNDFDVFSQVVVGKNINRIFINRAIRDIRGYSNDLHCDERLVVTANNARHTVFNGQIIYLIRDGKVRKDHYVINFIDEYEKLDAIHGALAEPRTCKAVIGVSREHQLEKRYAGCIHIDYGYAITVHRAQGSSWENVMVYDDGFGRWSGGDIYRRWLYTAITRAERQLTIAVP